MKPFVKWAGGKRQILDRINDFIKESANGNDNYRYIEPFLGGGAVFFNNHPKKAIINDLNEDLINAYDVIQSNEYLKLIKKLEEHDSEYRKSPDDYYYHIREQDRLDEWNKLTKVDRAARMIFLNKTCYNGLYRVNSKGQFNTPIGRYKNPLICDEKNIKEIHDYLSSPKNSIEIMHGSYEHAIKKAEEGDIIYIDPPYDYEDDDGFTKYQMSGFTFEDFKKLKYECDKAILMGAFVILSNNATKKVIELFEQDPNYKIYYEPNEFTTLRSINCVGSERRTGKEVIFWGMDGRIPLPQANDISKVIKIMCAGEDAIKDKKYLMNVLGVGTERQVSYYLAALSFLGYITSKGTFTDEAKEILGNKQKIEEGIFKKLKNNDIFKDLFFERKNNGSFCSNEDIEDFLMKNNKSKLSISTIKRRASTIKKWLDWMIDYEKETLLS